MTKIMDEAFNDPEEIHAFINGMYTGFVEWKGIPTLPQKEKHYFQAGWLIGVITKYIIIALTAKHLI